MATHKHIDRICAAAMAVALVLTALFMGGEALGISIKASAMGYEDRLFDTARVHTIDIVMEDWDGFLSTAQSEQYSLCSVVIDGEAFKNVGIRAKGNTSLSTVASMDSERYSFKIEFDQYDSTQSYYGLDKISLNNLIQDNTMMKDYLVYRMMAEFDVAAPLCSYVYITVNGEDWGLYLAVEAVEESFLQRNYGSSAGNLYKPDSTDMGGGRGNGNAFDFDDFAARAADQSREGMGFDFSQMGGAQGGMSMGTSETTLQYIDDQISSYTTIWDSAKTDITTADQQRLIASLKSLSQYEALDTVLDMDAVLRYFVVHNYVVNGDSYTGSMVHNYYLYEQDGQLSMIPWDYNLAFGTFQSRSADQAVNDLIDAPLSVTGSGRPMIDWIFSSSEYTERYHQYFQEFLDNVDIAAIISQAQALIAPYVEKDPTKFCTFEEFEAGVDTLETFCSLRTESVRAQLAGEAAAVDASAIDLSDMGTMSQGGMGGMSDLPGQDFDLFQSADRTDGQQRPGQDGELPFGNGSFPQMGDQMPGGMERPDDTGDMQPGLEMPGQSGSADIAPLVLLGASLLILAAGLVFAFKFKR